jgi:outer membrane protein insertion porin family
LNFSERARILAGMTLILCLGIAFVVPVRAETIPTVITFEIQGNSHVPMERILGVVTNTRMGAPFDPKRIQLDAQAIMALGYFTDVRVRTEKMLDGVNVIFEVFENPLFQEVQVSGLTNVKQEELKPFFSQEPGEVFNTVTFKEDLSKAIKFCQEKKGLWVQPKVQEKIGISADGIIKVELVELKYGKIKTVGLVKTKEIVVLRELSFKTGDIINQQTLQNDMARLMRLRIFDGIEPQLEMSEIPDSLDLILQFKEAQTGTFTFGVSYSETSQTWGGILGYGENNLMGTGQSLSLNLDYSLDETQSRQVEFSFREPWLNDKHTSFGLSIWNSDSIITSTMGNWGGDEGYEFVDNPETTNVNEGGKKFSSSEYYDEQLVRTGLGVSLGRELWRDTTGQLQLSFEKNGLKAYWDKDTDPDDETVGNSLPMEVFADSDTQFWDNSIKASLIRNRLNYIDSNFVNGGYRLSADYTVAGHYIGGAYDYNKLVLDGRWFMPLGRDFVLGTRLQGAMLDGEYPDYDALYLGGMYRLRGYDNRRYRNDSTKDLVGDAYLLSNTELRYRIPGYKNLELVAFYDAGQINDGGTETIKSDYGIGFRFSIPMLGLIRLDKAWNADGEDKFVFSLGELF